MGFHISGFNILVEDFSKNDTLMSDVDATLEFLERIHNKTKEYSEKDSLDRYTFHQLKK